MIAKTNTEHYQNIADEIRTANDYAAFKSEIEVDNELFEDIGEAIAEKDGGEIPERSEIVERIGAIRTLPEFDMTVEDNQVKMVVEVNDHDLSFWTRFGISGGGTVTVDWGDGTSDEYTGDSSLEYAPQRKHNYQEVGKYLITETINSGALTIGSINSQSTLSEGEVSGYYNAVDVLRRMYNCKVKELIYGNNIIVSALQDIPYIKLYNGIDFSLSFTSTDFIKIKNGTTSIGRYWFNNTLAYSILMPSSIVEIKDNAFDACKVRIIDFTNFQLNENNELPFVVTSSTTFRNMSNSTILLFAAQEIAEVAKNTTNLSQYANKIKYVGEVEI